MLLVSGGNSEREYDERLAQKSWSDVWAYNHLETVITAALFTF